MPAKTPKTSLTRKAQTLEPPEVVLDAELIRMASTFPDLDGAQAALDQLLEAKHKARNGAELAQLGRQIAAQTGKIARLERELAALAAEAADLDPHDSKAPEQERPFRDWVLRDRIECLVLTAALVIALGASLITTQANLMASGLPIFLEQLWLSWVMGLMPAMGAIALKVVVLKPTQNAARYVLTLGLFSATVLTLLLWVLLFALQYHGVSGSFDPFAESSGTQEIALVAVQVLAEMLIGATLALRVTEILRRYAPDGFERSDKRLDLKAMAREVEAELDTATRQLGALEGQSTALNGVLAAEQAAAGLTLKTHFARFQGVTL